jgi:hypothetical protein
MVVVYTSTVTGHHSVLFVPADGEWDPFADFIWLTLNISYMAKQW